MPSNDPMWYCHECVSLRASTTDFFNDLMASQHAEMRPLFVPDARCASCNGTFVEQIDTTDDPRNVPPMHFEQGTSTSDTPEPIFRLIQGLMSGRPPGSMNMTPRPPGSPSSPGAPASPGGRSSSSFSVEIRSGPPGSANQRRVVFGGPNTLGRAPGSSNPTAQGMTLNATPMTLAETMQGAGGMPGQESPRVARDPFENPMLLQQYLLSMLGMPSSMMEGGPMEGGGRMGDYVFSQQALEQIMNQLMENGHKPVALSEKAIDELPRGVLSDDSPLIGKDCQICQDTFEVPKPDDEDKEPGMLTTVELPCKHSFHEDCIVPWLKQSGTCPVCRHALVAQPAPPPPPGSGPAGPSPPSYPGGGSGPGGFFGSLFGMGGGGSGNNPAGNAGGSNEHGGPTGDGGRTGGSTASSGGSARQTAGRNPQAPPPGAWDMDVDQ